jgi:hypothetical protein
MAGIGISEHGFTSSTVRVVTIEQAVGDARNALDEFERRYGVASERLVEAFTDASGRVRKTGDYLRWLDTLERFRQLSARLAG